MIARKMKVRNPQPHSKTHHNKKRRRRSKKMRRMLSLTERRKRKKRRERIRRMDRGNRGMVSAYMASCSSQMAAVPITKIG